ADEHGFNFLFQKIADLESSFISDMLRQQHLSVLIRPIRVIRVPILVVDKKLMFTRKIQC
ncbi:MAG: hypothetical protein ABI402_05535, partial [Ferruginibacter sp.]